MAYDFYNSDIIDQYIHKLLPEEIQLKMKASIEKEEMLALAVYLHLIAIKAVKQKAENDLRRKIRKYQNVTSKLCVFQPTAMFVFLGLYTVVNPEVT